MISVERLKEVLRYDPETGTWTWLVHRGCKLAGDNAGYFDIQKEYLMIGIDGVVYHAHRLAFLYMTGEIPERVDHKDTDRRNCKWNNLRSATHSENLFNRGPTKRNRTGFKGVFKHNIGSGYTAKITINKKVMYLGYFKTAEEAFDAYQTAAKQQHGEFYYVC